MPGIIDFFLTGVNTWRLRIHTGSIEKLMESEGR